MDCSFCLQQVKEEYFHTSSSGTVICHTCLSLVNKRYRTRIVAPAGLRSGTCTFCDTEERGLVFTVGGSDVILASLCLQCFDELWDEEEAPSAPEVKEAPEKTPVEMAETDEEFSALFSPTIAEDAIWSGSCPACHRSIDLPTHCISYSKFLCAECIDKLRKAELESLSAWAVNTKGEAQCYGCGTRMYRGHHVDRRICLCSVCRKRFIDTESMATKARCTFCLFPIEEGGCEYHCKYCETLLEALKNLQGLERLHPKTPRELEEHTFLETNLTLYSIAATLIHIRYLYDWPGAAQRIIPQLIGAYEKVPTDTLNESYGLALKRVLEIHRSLEPK